MAFIIIESIPFVERLNASSLTDKERIERFILQLVKSGDSVGKPLGFPFLREKKFNGNRLYYLVYSEWKAILLVTISDKKEQADTIQHIKTQLENYRKYMQEELQKMRAI